MELLVCWILFPSLLGVLSWGCGAVVQALAGVRLSGALLPCGLALMIGVLELTVRLGSLRQLAVPIVVLSAAAGFVLAWPPVRPSGWPIAAAIAVFAVFAGPVVLSGHATFAGYIKLDDTATFFALTDRVFDHGLGTDGLAPSTYEATLGAYLGSGYPVGSFVPLGLGHALLGEDIAWLFAPYLAFVAAMLALVLETIAAALVRPAWQRAAIAFVAAQAALLYAYALWGGVKELVAALLIASFVAASPLAQRPPRLRAWIPAAVVAGAMVAALTIGGLVWLLPPAVAAGLISLRSFGLRRVRGAGALVTAGLLGVAIALSLTAGGFLKRNLNTLSGRLELGNLIHPLDGAQILGVWPTGDFRLTPDNVAATDVLLGVVALAGAIGLVTALIRRAWVVALYLAAAGLGALVIGLFGSPWLAGKALATASPAFVLVALIGAAVIAARGRRIAALLGAVAIAAGVTWSNVLAYHDGNLAPYGQLAELKRIGDRIAGGAPTLMTEFQPYGARHFLRRADPESASELRRRLVSLRDGQLVGKGGYADLSRFALPAVLTYRTLVLRRSPLQSRPPAAYARIFSGHYYDVWQRAAKDFAAPLSDLAPVGGDAPDCNAVRALATLPGVTRVVAAAAGPAPISIPLDLTGSPWPQSASDAGQVELVRAGTVSIDVGIPSAGRYAVWLQGSIRGTVSMAVDGAPIGSARDELEYAQQLVLLGQRTLTAGKHRLKLTYAGSDWRPGSGGPPTSVGPLIVAPADPPSSLLSVAPSAARRLCGRRVWWVEALAR